MAASMVLTVAQTLFSALQCKQLTDLCSKFRCQDDLKKLQDTAETIQALLLDIDSKSDVELSNVTQIWLERLKDTVYEVDDLIDEFNTIVQRNKLEDQTDGAKGIKKFPKKVRRFFSRSNKAIVAFRTSLDVEDIRNKLDASVSDYKSFGFSVNYEHIRKVRQETSSWVDKGRIFGREDDQEAIVRLLLKDHNSDAQKNVSFVSIVGMGGLGKTALAQLVYNDDRIKHRFGKRLWVCVSDEFGVREILSKMLKSVSNENWDHLGVDQLQRKVGEQLEGKKFLLVLDDVWCENHDEWVDLNDIFIYGERGSRILVTTRSNWVATAAGSDPDDVHNLEGLSPEDSWDLFAYIAYHNGVAGAGDELVKLGREIVKKCSNVPLSIKVTASMLYRQNLQKWQAFEKMNLSEIGKTGQNEDKTMRILKFSYNHLTPPLKSCFGYCALFPKDHRIKKELLIDLWSAHGCLEPQFEGQRIQDVGEEHFSILLNRCFFQEIKKDPLGDVESCKMHDLVHDLAQAVAGREMLSCSGGHFKHKLRHISSFCSKDLFNQVEVSQVEMIRTYLTVSYVPLNRSYVRLNRSLLFINVPLIVSNCKYLRVLHLTDLQVDQLPDKIGDLVHLRYLNLSYNETIEMLPKSITKLHNLQVMRLGGCRKLKQLPKDLYKLVNLRVLDIDECDELSDMPKGMGKLTSLETLSTFVAGKTNSKNVCHLDELEDLVQLSGGLYIKLGKHVKEVPSKATRRRCYPLVKSHLKGLAIEFDDCLDDEDAQAVLEGLQPNHDLRVISIIKYGGSMFPWSTLQGNSWRMLLPSLVCINLIGLPKMRSFPSMRQLENLNILYIENVRNLEYMEESVEAGSSSNKLTFFPHLEELELSEMENLKGWWRPDMNTEDKEASLFSSMRQLENLKPSFSTFPCLRKLTITECPNLISFPSCPLLQFQYIFRDGNLMEVSSDSEDKEVDTDKIGGYKNFEEEEVANGLVSLKLFESVEESVASGMETARFLKICGSSLRHLEIFKCRELKRVGKGVFEHLPNLHSLEIKHCEKLTFEEEEDEEGMMSWKFLVNLSKLILYFLPKMVKLPKGIQYLTSLQSLVIIACFKLTSLPEWMGCLSSLQHLVLVRCNSLESLPTAIRDMPSLTHLTLLSCDNLESLPRAIRDMPSLTHLTLLYCHGLKSLPRAIRDMPSLTHLTIHECDGLTSRCKYPD